MPAVLTCWLAAVAAEKGGVLVPGVAVALLLHVLFPTCPEGKMCFFRKNGKELSHMILA